jgi:methylmalonyl-CoA/ethylmalonyl-CoA epimerase
MIKQINHIGIAVSSLQEQIPFYRDVLGLPLIGIEEVADQKVKVAMFRVGEVQIELLEPTSEDSPIAKFLSGKGPGLHHIAFETDDIEAQLQTFEQQQISMIDRTPRAGAHGTRIAFIHPRSSGKVLTEICETTKSSR